MENDINNLLVAASKILTEHKQETQSGKYFNCVDICGVGEIETRHSGIIAALLDPHGNHGLGAESLKAFSVNAIWQISQITAKIVMCKRK